MTKKIKLEQFDSVMAERDILRLAVHDLTNTDRITWGSWYHIPREAGQYRAGLSRHGAVLFITFRHPGQSDHTAVYDAFAETSNIRRLRLGSESWEPHVLAIRSAEMALARSDNEYLYRELTTPAAVSQEAPNA